MSSPEDLRRIHAHLIAIWSSSSSPSHRRTVENTELQITNAIPNGWAASSLHKGYGKHVIKMKPGKSWDEYLATAMHEAAHAVLHDMEHDGYYRRKLPVDLEELTVQMITFMGLTQYKSGTFVAAIEFAKRVLIYEYIPRFGSIQATLSTFPTIRAAFTNNNTLPPYLDNALTIISSYPTQFDPRQAMPSIQTTHSTHWRRR